MARKKHKAAKRPPAPETPIASSAPNAAGMERILLPAAGWTVLLLAWLALLGGFVDGTLDLRAIFHPDAFIARTQFRDLFLLDEQDVTVLFSPATHYFPDALTQWALFALGAGAAVSPYLTSLLWAALSAVGWILACDALFGKSPARRCAVALLHALPMLVMAWRGPDLFWGQLNPYSHYGIVATVPWALWLSVRVLQDGARPGGKGRNLPPPAGFAIALTCLTAAMVASDLFALPWFVAPAGFSAVALARLGRLEWRRALWFCGLLAAGSAGGRLLYHAVPLLAGIQQMGIPPGAGGLENAVLAVRTLAAHMLNAAARNPAEALVWLAFVALAAWRAAALLRPTARKNMPPMLGVPDGFGHSLAAVYAPAAVLAGLGAALLGLRSEGFSYMEPSAPAHSVVAWEIRYYMPAWFVPLFAGWALLPGPRASARAALAACAVAAALAAPKIARMDLAALDPFRSPFYQCFTENARRLNWRAGLSSPSFRMAGETPGAESRILPALALRHPDAGRSLLAVDIAFNLKRAGEYQFVIANAREGRAFHYPPPAGEEGCAMSEPGACWFLPRESDRVLDVAAVRAAFGAPAEEINCAGVGLLHYDPPLKFDFTGRTAPDPAPAYLTPLARW